MIEAESAKQSFDRLVAYYSDRITRFDKDFLTKLMETLGILGKLKSLNMKSNSRKNKPISLLLLFKKTMTK
jgi:hypothetical protein